MTDNSIAVRDGHLRPGKDIIDNGPLDVAYIAADKDDSLYVPKVTLDGPLSAFGEIKTIENTPQAQLKFSYGINTRLAQVCINKSGGSSSVSNGVASLVCAGSSEAFAQLRSKDPIRYGPGQGAEWMGTLAFPSGGEALSSQVGGCGDDDEGAYFGYDKTSFGILHRRFGSIEIRTIEITSAADAGGGDFVITMDGTAVTVTVGASATISEVTAAIVAKTDDFANAGRGWLVHTDDNVNVEFISFVSENATGTFSFVDTDSGVTAGVFQQDTTEVEGSAPTETWVAQADWNADPLDGSGPSGLNFSTSNTEFSPSNLNIYQVTFQYLGAGPIKYYIENPSNGRLILVHTVVSAGVTENAVFRDPSLRLSVIIKTDTGYTGGALTVKTASMGGFVQGKQTDIGVNNSASGSKTTTTTTPINILTIHNEVDFLGKENKVNVFPSFMTVSALGGNKSVLIEIVEEPTEVGGTVALTKVDSANSPMEFDVAGTTIVGGTVIFPVIIESGQSKEIDLTRFGFVLRPGARWVITARLITTGTNAAVSVGVTWLERF